MIIFSTCSSGSKRVWKSMLLSVKNFWTVLKRSRSIHSILMLIPSTDLAWTEFAGIVERSLPATCPQVVYNTKIGGIFIFGSTLTSINCDEPLRDSFADVLIVVELAEVEELELVDLFDLVFDERDVDDVVGFGFCNGERLRDGGGELSFCSLDGRRRFGSAPGRGAVAESLPVDFSF